MVAHRVGTYTRSEESLEKARAYDRKYSADQRQRARALKLCHRCRTGTPTKGTSTCLHCKRKLAILHMTNLRRCDRAFYAQVLASLPKP